MILRTWQDLEQRRVQAGEARCTRCHKEQDWEDDLTADEGAFLTSCCQEPAYLPDRADTLAERYGAAWETFIPVPPALLALRRLAPAIALVAVALLGRLHLEAIYPGQDTLAAETGLTSRTVRDALARFDAAGLIKRTRRNDRAGHRTSDLIDLSPLVAELNRLAEESVARPTGKTCARRSPVTAYRKKTSRLPEENVLTYREILPGK